MTVTPVFIPVSTGDLKTLPRDKLAKLLSCSTDHLEIVLSAMSTLFDSTHQIVCAYTAVPRGLARTRGPESVITVSNVPKELCTHAIFMAGSLENSLPEINGNVLFFYLKAKKNFLVQPDFNAAQAAIAAWDRANWDGNWSQETFETLAKVFKKHVTSPTRPEYHIDHFNAVVFPALEQKPFITRLPCMYVYPS
ncbi:hypothetical protein K439DRAFT_1614843 [Ramaria rubella]|nr:hypothetical protein K439DRAFT_1614843 [Ramaria rubella]